MVFTETFKGVSRKLKSCFKEVSSVLRMIKGNFKGVSRKFPVVLRGFQGYFKDA